MGGIKRKIQIKGASLWQLAENYLSVCGEKYRVTKIEEKQITLSIDHTKRSFIITALKICSFATIVLPAAAFFITYRKKSSERRRMRY
ncbi:hypothetical protein PHSC3_001970 [Chlamydiales bacterium STE3]|nr:hypothetical protein PHSC3_001970 [Chlamydiales bacterium STE3]